ncbi:MAG: GFA family protein [Hyphomonadaceae bacterium]|nr:GFA family protein [Hyphomonadaceae bacterium]
MTESRTPVAAGGCQCGAVRYALYVTPENSHVCHCRMCQRATGGLFAALAGAPKAAFAWTKGRPAIFASSNLAERAFCADCGTPLSFTYVADPGARFYVTIGSLDAPEEAPILRQYGVESRLSWVRFCEDVPGEATGESDAAQGFFAGMVSRQA